MEYIPVTVDNDHPLYRRESRKVETHVLNLARLITSQEVSLMHSGRSPRQAFQRQSKLLRDCTRGLMVLINELHLQPCRSLRDHFCQICKIGDIIY